jgi:hypothetical protein
LVVLQTDVAKEKATLLCVAFLIFERPMLSQGKTAADILQRLQRLNLFILS